VVTRRVSGVAALAIDRVEVPKLRIAKSGAVVTHRAVVPVKRVVGILVASRTLSWRPLVYPFDVTGLTESGSVSALSRKRVIMQRTGGERNEAWRNRNARFGGRAGWSGFLIGRQLSCHLRILQ
jgi:hypothetical protein